ncbi:MAG TPA: head GIN domain-containing protein [Chitinophagaceae bacterium]|jgi:hypothetical protein
MRKIYLFALSATIIAVSCDMMFRKTVHGNGNLTSQQRTVSNAERIKSMGNFSIDIIQGSPSSVKVEADENLLPYILTENSGDRLVIRTKEGYNLSSQNKLKVTVTTDKLEEVELNGSGNVNGIGKFSGADHLKISVAGSGDINLSANTPAVESSIAGTGNITLSGETKSSKIEIAGVGDYKAEDLMSENVEIHIAGSGNARVYAENNLDIHIAGSGDVFYKGNASVKQDIAGSGKIRKEE